MSSNAPMNSRKWIPGAPPVLFLEIGTAGCDDALPTPQPTEEIAFKSVIREIEQPDTSFVFSSLYGADDIPVFGRQYGMGGGGGSSKNGESSAMGALMSEIPRRKKPNKSLNPYEELLIEADSELDKIVSGSDKSSGLNGLINYYDRSTRLVRKAGAAAQEPTEEDSLKPLLTFPDPQPTTCVICTEDFTPNLRPPVWITAACLHPPSVCCPCLAESIKSDLDTKLWNQIRCPEENCEALLIYDDVKRLSDAITFSRYEILSFRSAVSADPNFVWCQSCNFGQLHTSGNSSPIVRCLNCNHRTCFVHQVAWHDRLTCAEYDQMMADPDNFVPSIDKSNDALVEGQDQDHSPDQEQKHKRKQNPEEEGEGENGEEEQTLTREESHRQRLAEQKRQRLKHEEARREARDAQNAQAAWMREAYERAQEEYRAKENIRELARQRLATMEKLDETTKPCPGCQWRIEKNEGCDHMTCIKCNHEFCWECKADYKDIRQQGNHRHLESCKYWRENPEIRRIY